MDILPDEMLDRIFSFLPSEDLPAVLHASSRFRRIASPHLRSRLAISPSDVQAGTVELVLSDSLHLILFVAHICPIQRLVCFRDVKRLGILDPEEDRRECEYQSAMRFGLLTSILAATDPIPDVLVHSTFDRHYLIESWRKALEVIKINRRGAVMGLLGDLPQTRTNLLIVVMNDAVYTSRPPPVPWRSFGCDSLAHLLFIIAKRGFGLLLPWAYRLWNGRESWLETEARLTRDLGDMLKWDTIRIQMLPENHTLVTFQTQDPTLISRDSTFKLNNLPLWWSRHTPAAHAALLANLDRGPSLKHLKVKIRCSVTFTDLFAIIDRHESVRYLSCSPFSLTPVLPMPVSPSASNITQLSAPPAYIPHLLRIAPNVQRIYIKFPQTFFHRYRFDYTSYRSVLDAIAEHPGTTPLLLSFGFDFSVPDLPCCIQADDTPETRLHRVTHILVQNRSLIGYFIRTETSTRALAAWIDRFPSLRNLSFAERVFWPKGMSSDESREFAESISGMSASLDPESVKFSIPFAERMGWEFR